MHKIPTDRRFENFTGNVFGKWTVIEYAGLGSGRRHHWRCRCVCGRESLVPSNNLKHGRSKSCLHCRRGRSGAEHRTGHPAYNVWSSMIDRCNNPSAPSFNIYGGRGISVCERWRKSFDVFLSDMGERPSLAHSIDRIDNDGNYEPSNCRWATPKEQSRNRRNNRVITIDGFSASVAEWAERVGIRRETIYARLNSGMCPEDAVFTPLDYRFSIKIGVQLEHNGLTMNVAQWSRELGIPASTISHRLRLGWSVHRALTTPVRHLSRRPKSPPEQRSHAQRA